MLMRVIAILMLTWSVQSHAIVNGQPVLGSEFHNAHQYFVTLRGRKPTGGIHECAATLIHPKFILTVKHCLKGNTLIGIYFFTYRSGRLTTVEVNKEKVHWYEPENENPGGPDKDIGMVMIDAAPSFAKPVTFMPEGWDPTTEANVYTVSTAYTPDFKRGKNATSLSYVKQNTPGVFQHGQYFASVIPKFPLTQKNQPGICKGDSGAPTFVLDNGLPYFVGHLKGGTRSSSANLHAWDQPEFDRPYTFGDLSCDLNVRFFSDTPEIEMLNYWMQYMANDPTFQVKVKAAN